MCGGVYEAEINFTDLFEQKYESAKAIQILAKEQIKIETNKVFMWIFDCRDFKVKDILEIADYEIKIDEETNAKSTVKVLKNTTAKANDIVAIKKNNSIVFWGVIDEIQNENGQQLYEYILKYITNIFDENVPLSKNAEDDEIKEGYYVIRSSLDTTKVLDIADASKISGANVQLHEFNDSDAQKWKITKDGEGYYTLEARCSKMLLDVAGGVFQNGTNLQQCIKNNSDAQRFNMQHVEGSRYRIKTKGHELFVDVADSNTNDGTNIRICNRYEAKSQEFILEKLEDIAIKEEGIEDFIANAINNNFVTSKDVFANKAYIEVRVKTHTKLKTSVTNVQENMYNLHTWMTNCTQLYNINYNIYREDRKLIIEIENKIAKKKLIDVNAHAISNYTEVFSTDIVSKVEVLTSTETYYLYLLNDRTTTTNVADENRAAGKTERIYTQNYEDAEQKALDTIKANSYNHNITFDLLNEIIKVGTPIAIKTKNSVVHDTYISAITITPSKFISYTVGSIRIGFIDKLLKERNKR